MKITTESGAVYDIRHGVCYYSGSHGEYSFKIWSMKMIDADNLPATWDELHAMPNAEPEIGKRMYVAGREEWRISTKIVSIEDASS